MGAKRGYECVLNYKEGGISGVGTWTELTNVKDVTLSNEAGEWDMTTRASAASGYKASMTTLKEGSVEFGMLWDTADPGFTAIQEAYFTNAAIGLQILDGDGGQGLQADFNVKSFTRTENLEEGVMVNVTCKITFVDTAPEWIGA